MILSFRPIDRWPVGWQDTDRDRTRKPCQFEATYLQTLNDLDRELRQLGATDAFLQVDAAPNQLRLDGQLKADARVAHPGVILTVDTRRHGVLTYQTDKFRASEQNRSGRWSTVPGWQNNLRAIALGLESLRRVDRYGIAEAGQQYTGWKALGSGIALGPSTMTVEQAEALLIEHGEWGDVDAEPDSLIGLRDVIDLYYRSAAKRTHPDAGGDPDLFRRLTEARDLLLQDIVQ